MNSYWEWPTHFFGAWRSCQYNCLAEEIGRHIAITFQTENSFSAVIDMDGVPHDVLGNWDLMELVLPTLRSDFS